MLLLLCIQLCTSANGVCPGSTITLTAADMSGLTKPRYYDCETEISSVTFDFGDIADANKVIPSRLFRNCRFSTVTIDSILISLPNSVTTIGDNAFEYSYLSSLTFSSSSPGLATIGKYAFQYCSQLSSIGTTYTNFDSLTTIGENAFSNCQQLSTIGGSYSSFGSLTTIGENAFYYCRQLTYISAIFRSSDKLTKVGKSAFYYAGSYSSNTFSLSIPDDLTEIPDYAFYGSKISGISVNDEPMLSIIGSYAFANTEYFSNTESVDLFKATKLTTIKSNAFYNSYDTDNYNGNQANPISTYKIILPSSLTTIENSAFAYSDYKYAYHTIFFPPVESLQSVGNKAFERQMIGIRRGSYEMYEVSDSYPLIFPASIESIGEEAFKQVQNSDFRVDFSKATSLHTIDDRAFYKCNFNTYSDLHLNCETIKEIGRKAFLLANVDENNQDMNTKRFKYNFYLKNLDHITRIGDDAYYCQIVEFPDKITFQSGLYYIGDHAFCLYSYTKTVDGTSQTAYHGSTIYSISFPENNAISYIGISAFENQKHLVVTTPIQAHIIGDNAFHLCPNLNTNVEIVSQGSTAGSIGKNAFLSCVRFAGTLKMINPETTSTTEYHPLSSIDSYAFQNTNIQSADLPHMSSIGTGAFKGCANFVANPNTLEVDYIYNEAFKNCYNLVLTSIKSTYIGKNAFENCHKLGADINIYFNLDYDEEIRGLIDDSAFLYCKALGHLNYDLSNIDGKEGYIEQNINQYAFCQSDLKGPLSIPYIIKDIGQYAFAYCKNLQSLEIESNITTRQKIGGYAFYYSSIGTNLNIPNTVVSIGEYAFAFTGITTLTVQGSVYADLSNVGGQVVPVSVNTDIEDNAFYSCTSLNNVQFQDGFITLNSDSFKRCAALRTVKLGKITDIPSEAFYGMSNIQTIEIPDTVTSIGSKAFAECSGLTSVTFGTYPQIKSIGASAFYKCTNLRTTSIPVRVKTVESHTYYKCSSLQLFQIPEFVTKIEDFAFYGCSSFSGTLNLPGELTTIEESAFQNSGISGSLTFPDSLKTIEENAFRGCKSLTGGLAFGRSITDIGKNAFKDCSGFSQQITFLDYLTNDNSLCIDEGAFDGCSGFTGSLRLPRGTVFGPRPDSAGGKQTYGKNAFRDCSGFDGNLYLPPSVTYVPEGTFSGCSKFTGEIPLHYVTNIETRAFYDCSGFNGNLDLNGLTTIPSYAFYNCRGLNGELITNSKLSTVEQHALQGCSGLKGTLNAEELTKVEKYAFAGCSGLTGQLHFADTLQTIEEYAFEGCSGFSDHLSFKINGKSTTPISIEQRAFKGCSGFKNGRLTFTVTSKEEQFVSSTSNDHNYYRYDYFLKIGNEAFEDTKFKDIYYIGRFEPDCDYDIGISKIKGIHTSSNYANKTFCNYPLHSNKLSGGAIAGIVIACIVVVAVIVFLIIWFILRNKKNKDKSEEEVEMNQDP